MDVSRAAEVAAGARNDARLPGWVGEWVAGVTIPETTDGLSVVHGARASVVSARVAGAVGMPDEALEEAVVGAYRAVAGELRRAGRTAVRFWNHVPGITTPARGGGAGRDRYMVFNAGRYRALREWLGTESFETRVATASGVGTRGADLVIHCLAMDAPGLAVNNPRQVAPYHYSQRFGPLPPCFARATLIQSDGLLFVGGTASVRGEDSFFRHDLSRQLRETFLNLGAVVAAARARSAPSAASPSAEPRCAIGTAKPAELLANLPAYRDLRVYVPRPADETAITAAVRAAMPNVRRLETVTADLCRPELLVEVEGVAEVGAG